MPPWLLLTLGFAFGVVATLPLVRVLLRRGEQRARAAERRARDAERLAELGSMTGGLAHEIKNPLSTVGLNAQLLAEGIAESNLPPAERDRLLRRLEVLAREVERLRHILTDFLQFAGRMRLDPQPVDLVDLLNDVADFYLPQAEQAGIELHLDLPDRPVLAHADQSLLKQAILNLLINATQAILGERADRDAPPDRRDRITLRLRPDDHAASVHVLDTGPGVAPEKREEIFRPYVSGRPGGSGLGLPTARRIVEEHGGTLAVQPAPPRGSDFTLTLPLHRTRTP